VTPVEEPEPEPEEDPIQAAFLSIMNLALWALLVWALVRCTT
jgi:hypothetical protein